MHKQLIDQDYKLVVYDFKEGNRIGTCWIEDTEIIGRLTAGDYTLMDGHLYFDNAVFKFRYDEMLASKVDLVEENLFINKYDYILDL